MTFSLRYGGGAGLRPLFFPMYKLMRSAVSRSFRFPFAIGLSPVPLGGIALSSLGINTAKMDLDFIYL